MTQVARTLGLQKRFDEALAVLGSVSSSESSEDREVSVRLMLENGRVINSRAGAGGTGGTGAPSGARPLFELAYASAAEAGFEHLAIDALHMVAIVESEPSEQAALNERALLMADAASDPRARDWRASLLNNLGWARFSEGSHDSALEVFQDAVAARIAQGKVAETQIARWCVARTMRALGRVEEALAIQTSLAEEHAAAGTSDSYVDEEIAACKAELAAAAGQAGPNQTSTTPDPGSA